MEFLRQLADIRTPFFDKFFSALTYFGDELVVIVVICALFWCINKNLAYKLGFIYFVAGIGVQALKIGFRIERPWLLNSTFHPVPAAVERATGYSFPSGHTQGATALYSVLFLAYKNKWLRIGCVFLAVSVIFSRMYLGVHTPADVIVAFLMTMLTVVLFMYVIKIPDGRGKNDFTVALIMALASAALAVYALIVLNTVEGVVLKDVSDTCKAAGAGFGFAVGWYVERQYIGYDTKMPTVWGQIIKFIIGIAVALALKEGIKMLFGESIPVSIIRYVIVVIWVLAAYPALVMNYLKKKQ